MVKKLMKRYRKGTSDGEEIFDDGDTAVASK